MVNIITCAPTSSIHTQAISPHLLLAPNEAHRLLGLKGPACRSAG
jgi:uncharacterized protein (DUF849 family)